MTGSSEGAAGVSTESDSNMISVVRTMAGDYREGRRYGGLG